MLNSGPFILVQLVSGPLDTSFHLTSLMDPCSAGRIEPTHHCLAPSTPSQTRSSESLFFFQWNREMDLILASQKRN